MKSKISFINRTMLQKNVKLYWPIWTLYTIVLLLNGPFSMWSRFKNAEFIYGKNWHKYMLDIISPAISMEADMIFIFVMALVTGMAMFSYLYNSRACNMIHSMPVTRRQLFSTNVLTGLLFMWIPQRRSGRKRQIRSVSIPVQNLKCSKRQRQEPSVQLQVLPKHTRERDLALRRILPCRCWNRY